MVDFSEQLSKYMPAPAAPIVSAWIRDTGCLFRISRSRKSKLGDYMPPYRGAPHRISVNHDLNPYAFLITTIHEFAHLKTYQEFGNRVRPHGVEWKRNYKKLMAHFLQLQIFPADILQAVEQYMENPAASSCSDLHLFRALSMYDTNRRTGPTVESIPQGGIFAIRGGRIFQKIEKLRKRYKCVELETSHMYTFHPTVEVVPIDHKDVSRLYIQTNDQQ
ncbi:hypothetical protein BC792_11412 [Sphingobacterium allocomposti]|uniref:SprT-like domain-containing protein n=1 Tax=Sphingobacterium allocomposti TaxID=415956 RepID=A0A5S5DB66_9SPHI|nr:sprT domain-containing protein [Sphingobacterium composti Yoo et al. 2007 non Ten et al. 2007]TYP93111.1 hypothetical protein BC792_11412 [Sphingobacterium composti Yoo et al. 2007 non Ten et al. 2007]